MSAPSDPGPLSDLEFDRITAELISSIEAQVDRWLQDDVIDIDSLRTGGLLELVFPGGSKIVINTQPPLHELWLAARAGGWHFRHVQGRWIDREGQEFLHRLSESATEQAHGLKLEFHGA